MADSRMGDVLESTQSGDTRKVDADGYIIRETTAPATDAAHQWAGWGTALKPAHEPIVVARKPLSGTVAANVLAHGTGALNIDATRVPGEVKGWDSPRGGIWATDSEAAGELVSREGRWPANVALDHHTADELDHQTGDLPTQTTRRNPDAASGNAGMFGLAHRHKMGPEYLGETGGASRFFPTFRYEAKAPTTQRPSYARDAETQLFAGSIRKRCTVCGKQEVNVGTSACACDTPDFQPDPSMLGKVAHPTVKPLDLMRWLVRLVTPPGGTVLDPFAGSGTTAEACLVEGFRCVTVEREADYLPLIVDRLNRRSDPAAWLRGRAAHDDTVDLGLFGLLDEDPA